jgi:hypothetical protein
MTVETSKPRTNHPGLARSRMTRDNARRSVASYLLDMKDQGIGYKECTQIGYMHWHTANLHALGLYTIKRIYDGRWIEARDAAAALLREEGEL